MITAVIVVTALMSSCTMQNRAKIARTEIVTINMTVLFNFNKYVLKKSAKPILDRVVAKIREYPRTFIVLEGHTDRVGSAAYNEVLAEKRVRAVGAYLSQKGVKHDRITFISMGERQPKDTRSTREAHRKNRRVEIYNR